MGSPLLQIWNRNDKRFEQSKRMVHQSSSSIGRHGCTTSTGRTQSVNFKKTEERERQREKDIRSYKAPKFTFNYFTGTGSFYNVLSFISRSFLVRCPSFCSSSLLPFPPSLTHSPQQHNHHHHHHHSNHIHYYEPLIPNVID